VEKLRRGGPILMAGPLVALLAALPGCRGDTRPAARLRVSPESVRLGPGACATIDFEWSPLRELDRLHGRPEVFVHLLDRPVRPFQVLQTFDHPLPFPWRPGRPQRDVVTLCQSALPQPLPAGTYFLTAGLVDDSWGYRWPLEVDGGLAARREYRIGTVELTSAQTTR
jgi:hypothetical protein